jgi:hypothetical protein
VKPLVPRRRLIQTLVALAGLLLVAPVVAALASSELLVVHRALDHPYLFPVIAVGLVVAAAGLSLRDSSSRRRKAGAMAIMVVGVLGGLFGTEAGFLSGLDSDQRVVNHADAPLGKDYQAIMLQSANPSEGIETVLIRSGHGARTRQWVAACEGVYTLKTAAWAEADRLTITLQDDFDPRRNGETFVIRVDPESGRPQTRTDGDLNCL